MSSSTILYTFLIVYVLERIFTLGLKVRNAAHIKRHRGEVPKEYEGHVDSSTAESSVDYALAKAKFGRFSFVMGCLVTFLNSSMRSYNNSYRWSHLILARTPCKLMAEDCVAQNL